MSPRRAMHGRRRGTWGHVTVWLRAATARLHSANAMSEDGLDDELIALVGEDKSSPPPRQLSPDRSKGRRAALIEDLSDSDEDEEEDASRALYPLEGIYKDADDREWYV